MARHENIKEPNITFEELNELFDEMSSQMDYYVDFERKASRELTYLKDFIRFKQLDEEFTYFVEHAIEDPDDELPFPHLVLK